MSTRINEYEQPIGEPLPHWSERPLPGDVILQGAFCRLEPFSAAQHAHELYMAYSKAPDGRDWTYLPVGPFDDARAYLCYAESVERTTDPKHYAVIDMALGHAVGTLALMRTDARHGAIEVGWVMFSPLLKQKPASTEAQFLLMQYVFDNLQYRRYEWKCDSLNEPSRKTALRLGFTFEGLFRQSIIYKQRSRDTAWFSIIDKEWPHLKQAFLAWLAPENFDSEGSQLKSLAEIRDGSAKG
ncbi:GNAT family N-acetyltransferase [Pectobacterium parmentieri]|uniref:GNAT family N-acetyltransferase n=1 Tax=Pectobacterium parmentieri TaxID=1905730 RepID=UPI000CDD5CE9|nr:GNAT family protein [Pectobacterium parmentieri]AYH04559.1 GNAT family N-acetyltransferase [Pectobacterium parmentieri]AYH13381.1 GNAT family N-acetyltransferase [Pectobacterium parmentieri]AYH22083.1 GNAT family N-acetyltransferase [Pectobacterium parmentieri]MBN3179146.1 GNAT family N-acetyltransferase [Pectobacterium parmentieri]POW29441.1 GNAT family acetyltransferase [Pectobacterium parmentieri]